VTCLSLLEELKEQTYLEGWDMERAAIIPLS
jgi:hypothetical protein